ncbi:MAG: hypothetical protein HYS27_10540 [Deltaproteobacteria bacterium]|nr:hypothetical protein [Deltaproteobacteria bacterium]
MSDTIATHGTNAAILGLGIHLPNEVRANSWWPIGTVDRWRQRASAKISDGRADETARMTPNQRRVLEAMAQERDDPFRGARERRVMDPAQRSSDIETLAAREAIQQAGVAPADLDFVLVQSAVPDFLNTPNAAFVHQKLGLKDACFSLQTEGMCNSFLLHLTLADKLLRGGMGKLGLIVQSCGMSPTLDPEEPHSAWFGDAASAAVVGLVEGRGLLSQAHGTDSSLSPSIVYGVPGGRWFDAGRTVPYLENQKNGFLMLLNSADLVANGMRQALAPLGMSAEDVEFYGAHQATPWFRRVTQQAAGMTNARFVDTFPWAASVVGCNVPLGLAVAAREGMLKSGMLVGAFSGSPGVTWTAAVYRW